MSSSSFSSSRDALATVGDGDGELLVAVSTVGPHPTDDVGHPLLLWSSPSQGSLSGLRVGSDTGQVVLGRHRDHVVVGCPHKVDDIAWSYADLVLRHPVDPVNVH